MEPTNSSKRLDGVLRRWRKAMKITNILAVATIATGIALVPIAAGAQERLGDGAKGAVAGAIVGGPVGAIAGGVIGYTTGPDIAHAMGVRHQRYRHYAKRDHYREDRRH
jgi:hypothetical protein